MSIVSKVTAYGTPGMIAAGAGLIWGQTFLQWVTQPSHLLPVAGIAAVTALGLAKRKGKVAPEAPAEQAPTTPTAEQAQAYLDSLRAQALPPARGATIDYTAAVERQAQRRQA